MANDKIYGDYLMHYRTLGSKNGYTKYPDKYKPIGEKAQEQVSSNGESSGGFFDSAKKFINKTVDYVKNDVAPAVEKHIAKSVGPGMIRDEIKKNANPAIDNLMKPNTRTYASNEDRFKDFIRNDIRDRINVKSNVAKLRAASRMKKSLNTAINDPRINREFINILDKDHNHVERGIAESLTNPRKAKMYAQVGLDAAVPTYNRSKATTEDNFKTFMKNDLRDRLNKHLKIAKDRAATGYENFAERFLNDKRVQNDISEFRNNPYAAKDIARRKNVRDAAIDAAIPTYEKRKATTEDSFKTFMKNDIKDRANDLKKKGKKKIKGLVDKLFHGDDIMKNYLMHHGTPGMKWGKTKYPGKYTPVGKEAIDSTGRNFDQYKFHQRFWNPKDGGEGPAMIADKARAEARRIKGGNPYVNQREENRKAYATPESLKISTNFSDVNKRNAEDRRIKGGTYGQKTGENYYNDRGYNKRAFDARMRYEKRVKTPNSDKKASAERNARSTIGNAIHDAKTNKDFGSFMKKDIKDRVSKGKKKVKKLLSKWF